MTIVQLSQPNTEFSSWHPQSVSQGLEAQSAPAQDISVVPGDSGCVFLQCRSPVLLAGQGNAGWEGRKTQILFVTHSVQAMLQLQVWCTLYPSVWLDQCQLTQRSSQLLQEAGE